MQYQNSKPAQNTENHMKSSVTRITVKKLAIKSMLFNAQSIRSKFDEFTCYVAKEKPDLICITESWINEEIFGDRIQDYEIDGFNLFSCTRKGNTKGGGVMIYVNSLFSAIEVPDSNKSTAVESIWLDVALDQKKSQIRIGAFYRAGTLVRDFQVEHDRLICEEICRNFHSQCLILGDFNLKGYENAQFGIGTPECKVFYQLLEEHLFMQQFVTHPTRLDSFLDLVFSDDKDLVQNLSVGENLGNSDHRIIRFTVQLAGSIQDNLSLVPNFNRADFAGLRQALGLINWQVEFAGLNACQMWDKFKKLLQDIQAQYIPVKHRRKRKVGKPVWFSNEINTKIKAKKEAYRVMDQDCTEGNKKGYQKARDLVKKSVRRAKRSNEIDLARNCKGDSKKFFSFYSLSRATRTVGPLQVNGSVVSSDLEMTECLNNQFKSVFTDENTSNIAKLNCIPVTQNTLDDIQFIDKDMVLKHLKKIRSNKAEGPDEVYARILREAEVELSLPLSIIFAASLSQSLIPLDWKRANVVPIFKKGDKSKVENYRPVSLTSLVCKLLESIIKDAVVNFLEAHNLIKATQHGFRKAHSCLTNLLSFLDFATEQFDKGQQTDVAYLDFSKAFDKVPHQRLLIKLKQHGIRGRIVKWIESWLSGRQQRVVLNGSKSRWLDVISGVPQGSVLGPVLFIIFINDIDNGIDSNVLKFADDLKIFRKVETTNDHKLLQDDLDKIVKWSETWQMKFNFGKCKIMHIGRKNNSDSYVMDSNNLDIIEREKDLGVIINSRLDSSEQTVEARKKGLRMLGAINRNVGYKSKEVVKKLYTAYVRPHLEYCVQAWCPMYEKDCWLLERVQKRATKMINGFGSLSYEERLKQLDMFSLRYRRLRGDLIEVFKFVQDPEERYLSDLFTFNRNDTVRGHQYKIILNHSRTRLRQSFFCRRVVKHWNQLPNEIVSSSSLGIFKTKLDNHFRELGTAYQFSRET